MKPRAIIAASDPKAKVDRRARTPRKGGPGTASQSILAMTGWSRIAAGAVSMLVANP